MKTSSGKSSAQSSVLSSHRFAVRTGALPVLLAPMLALMLAGCDSSQRTTTTEPSSSEEVTVLSSTDEFQATGEDLGPREEMPGAAVYTAHCAHCHDGSVNKAPHFNWLELMTPDSVLASLNNGVMAPQAAALSTQQRIDVSEYVTRQRVVGADVLVRGPQCSDEGISLQPEGEIPAVGWGHDSNRFVPASIGQLTAGSAASLELKWTFGFPGALRARSQPAIAFGTVFVGSQDGTVYALDLQTGCEHWRFKASGEVRTGIVLARVGVSGAPMAFFGDILAKQYAVDAVTGELVWSRRMSDHPSATLTGTAAVHEQLLFVPVSSLEIVTAADPDYACCTFRGTVEAVDLATGRTVWTSYAIPNEPQELARTSVGTPVLGPSGAPVWTSPTIDHKRQRIYFGTGENYSSPADSNSDAMVAVDLASGERAWSRQTVAGDAWNVACMMADNPNCPEEDGPDFDHSSSLLLVDVEGDAGQQLLVAGHKNGHVYAFDPDNPVDPVWQTKIGRGSIQGGVHFGMAAGEGIVYAPINDMNDTRNGDVLDPELARPGMHALDIRTGTLLWSKVNDDQCGADREFCDPGISAPVTAIPGGVIAGHLDGVLRIYDARDGNVLFSFDTAKTFDTVNGVEARGGGMSGAGVAVGEGYLVTNSGYGLYFHEPGNLLAVFGAP